MMKFVPSEETSAVYGNDNLGLSISGAFLVLTPQKDSSKFKNVEKRRGCINYGSLTNFGMFEAGLQQEEASFVSSIAVTEECDCQNLTFNIKVASTPKPKKKASKCKEWDLEKIVSKKRRLQKKKMDISTSTNVKGCEVNFLKFMREKKMQEYLSKKSDSKFRLKKTIEKKSDLRAAKKINNGNFVNQYGKFLIEQQLNDFNVVNEQNISNNFNQFGQLKVWYVTRNS
ncbi:hypothetical protein BpHYR1_053074 [Brachionus plicatilis]|uniref:Uncharacterized protein n=1 Tax=Brachionus plicatilis TaxID=10195 RepID=A0A3M7PW58_BRAPC|nr:hypothetical protein BpHYR1_053074 [Brachionus plicatilis]